jgi:Protein of unknown function (DUF3999)
VKLWALLVWLSLVTQAISLLEYQRGVRLSPGAPQQYIVVTPDVWRHARPDLGDLRLYAAGAEVPYLLQTGTGKVIRELVDCKILQPSTAAGKTQLILDMTDMEVYDRVELQLETKNFVARARIEGANDVHTNQWALLGSSTLYDFASENLGHNGTLQMPDSTFRYLRLTFDGPVKPGEVVAAQAGITREEIAAWVTVAQDPRIEQHGHDTVLTFPLPSNVPVERVRFEIGNPHENFLRTVEVQSGDVKEETAQTLGTGMLRRIHMLRGGKQVDQEDDSISAFAQSTRAAEPDPAGRDEREPSRKGLDVLRVIVHNGDDHPLAISNAQLLQTERRIYFQTPAAASAVTLYYGDEKFMAPAYDYARLFQLDSAAGQADLLEEVLNSQYQKPADARPWSERHPAAMWAAMVAAILVLGTLALRSLRATAT